MSNSSTYSTATFIAGGGVSGAVYSTLFGNVGITIMGSGISIGVVPMIAAGAIAGSGIKGASDALCGDITAIGMGLIGAIGGATLYSTVGGVGLAGGFGAIGLGMGSMMASGGIFGLGAYALLTMWGKAERKEAPQAVFVRMEDKILWQEAYAQALLEVVMLSREWQEHELKQKFLELEFEDELATLKSQLRFQLEFQKELAALKSRVRFTSETSVRIPVSFSAHYYSTTSQKFKSSSQNCLTWGSALCPRSPEELPSELVWEKIQTFKAHRGGINAICLHPKDQFLITASDDKTLCIWEFMTGKHSFSFCGTGASILAVDISPDGCTLASGGGDRKVSRWDFKTRNLQKTFFYNATAYSHDGWIHSICYSSDGKTLASSSGDGTIRLWGTTTGNLIRTLKGHSDTVYAIAFSPQNHYLVSGSADQTIRVWDVSSGHSVTVIQADQGWVNCIALSPNGRLIASGGGDQSIKIWDRKSGHLLTILAGHSSAVVAIAFGPDGQTLVSGGQKDCLHVWNIEETHHKVVSGTLRNTLSFQGTCIRFSSDGLTLFSGNSQGIVAIWQLQELKYAFQPKLDQGQNWWDILCVDKQASSQEVKTAYHILARKYHPDLNPSSEARIKMQQLNDARQAYLNRIQT